MNNRFRFRVFDKERNDYVDDSEVELILHNDGVLLFGNWHEDIKVVEQDKYIVEQCTGVRDKNGNLIYENDRVGFYVYGQDEEWYAQQGTVIWYNSCWGIETSSRFIQFENELTIKNPKDIEIIGNVHKQPGQKD